jgi:hypothetical protein
MEEPRASRGRVVVVVVPATVVAPRNLFSPKAKAKKAEIATTRTRGAPLWVAYGERESRSWGGGCLIPVGNWHCTPTDLTEGYGKKKKILF